MLIYFLLFTCHIFIIIDTVKEITKESATQSRILLWMNLFLSIKGLVDTVNEFRDILININSFGMQIRFIGDLVSNIRIGINPNNLLLRNYKIREVSRLTKTKSVGANVLDCDLLDFL